jgi:hypothetical protein
MTRTSCTSLTRSRVRGPHPARIALFLGKSANSPAQPRSSGTGIPAAPAPATGFPKNMRAACCQRHFCMLELRSIQSWCQRASLRTRPLSTVSSPWFHRCREALARRPVSWCTDRPRRSIDRGPGISQSRTDAGPRSHPRWPRLVGAVASSEAGISALAPAEHRWTSHRSPHRGSIEEGHQRCRPRLTSNA